MQWFNNVTVGRRLLAGFGIALVLQILVAAGAWWALASVKSGVDVVVGENNRKTEMSYRMRAALEEVARAVRNIVISPR